VHHLSFGVFGTTSSASDRPREAGVRLLEPPPGIETPGLWFKDPDGTLIQLCAARDLARSETRSGIHLFAEWQGWSAERSQVP